MRISFFFFIAIVLLLAAGVGLLVLDANLAERFAPGVWVWDVPVGGLQPEAALPALRESLALATPRIVLVGPDAQRWPFAPVDLGVSLAERALLHQAYLPGHTQTGLAQLREWWELRNTGRMVAPVLVWDVARARTQLETLAGQLNIPPQDAALSVSGTELVLQPSRVGRRLEISATLMLLEPLLRNPGPAELPLIVTLLEPQVTDAAAAQALDVASAILAAPLQLLIANPLEDDPGPWTFSPEVLSQMLVIHADGRQVSVALDEAALTQQLEPLALALRREPVDARYHFEPVSGQLLALNPSRPGRALDVAATAAAINGNLQVGQHYVSLVLLEIAPRYPADATGESLGIRELVAVGESYFVGSSSARDHNIRLGATKFDGLVIAPGETFSFNAFLGEVTQAAGYDESYVIIGNRTVPGVGGGICQVATTAFRAAYFAGYPIVERWPHAYRVSYYELGGFGPGFDATIYSPLVDFRFTNDTPYHLLIETQVDTARARLRFLFYSTSDGRVVEQIGPTWGAPESPGPPIYEYDPTMPSGAVQRLENAYDGLRVELGRVVRDAAGEVLYQDRFLSHFVPWAARYRFGPDVIPPPDAQVIGLGP